MPVGSSAPRQRRRRLAHARPPATILGAVVILAGASVVFAGPPALATATTTFNNGTADATAIVARIAPGIGALELSTATGVAVTHLANKLATGKAQSADLGLIGSSLTAEQCNGQPAPLRPDQLPQPTLADNRKGDTTASSDEVPIAGSSLGGGREEVTATKQPLARAVSTLVDLSVPGLLDIGGGRAESETEVVDGDAREAHSTVDADLDIGGIVKLSGLHWDATHRTGAGASTAATFSIADAVVGSVPLPVDQLQSVEDAVNAALVPSGVTISFPHVEHLTKPNDLIRITPMRILLKDSPLGKTVLGPVLGLTRPQREQLFNVIVGVYCNAAAALLTGDITLSVASGTGFLVIDLGGAEATTADLHFVNPFGPLVPLPNLNIAPIVTPDVAGIFVPSPLADVPPTPAAAVSEPGVTDRVRCESAHTFRWPACSHGAATVAGLIGLVATAGIAGLDWRHQRRRRRLA